MTEPGFVGWTVPEGWTPDNIGRCRSCGVEVLWCLTPKGRKAPLDATGESHFATCPDATAWRAGAGRRGAGSAAADADARPGLSRLSGPSGEDGR